jgi:O-antigen/teichoic acid export membrane protein
MSLTALTSVGSSGFASSAVKFVSVSFTDKDFEKCRQIVSTTLVTVVIVSSAMSMLIYAVFKLKGDTYFGQFEYKLLTSILLLTFLSFILGSTGRVFQSSLDGMLAIKKRSLIGISSKVIYLILSLFLIKDYGLIGLTWALIARELFIVIVSAISLQKGLHFFILRSKYVKLSIFKEIFSYGYKFQINSIIWMLTDPLTKFLIKDFGGLSALGLFEVVYKLFWQVRMLIVVVMNTYLPLLASKKENISSQFSRFYNFTLSSSIILLSLIFPVIPIVMSLLDLTDVSAVYFASIILFVSLFFNLIGTVAYTHNLASGDLNSNLLNTVIFAIVNMLLGYIFGKYFSFEGVLVGWLIAHVTSSSYLLYSYCIKHQIPVSEIVNWDYIKLFFTSILAVVCLCLLCMSLDLNFIIVSVICEVLLLGIYFLQFRFSAKFKQPVLFIYEKVEAIRS